MGVSNLDYMVEAAYKLSRARCGNGAQAVAYAREREREREEGCGQR